MGNPRCVFFHVLTRFQSNGSVIAKRSAVLSNFHALCAQREQRTLSEHTLSVGPHVCSLELTSLCRFISVMGVRCNSSHDFNFDL